MRPAAALLLVSLLPACSVAVHTGRAAADNLPAGIEGSWKGSGSQSDQPGVTWTIALTLADGERGDVVGTITYPSLACGGDLILRDTGNGRVELLERITFGTCVDRGIVWLAPSQGTGGLAFDWREDNGSVTATGQLHRATPPVE